jgi:tripartite-type tricarboxylate transporter receptor subunit TctC
MNGPSVLTRHAPRVAAALTALLCAAGAMAQAAFPNRPIQLIVPYSAGSQNDAVVRALSEGLQQELGQPIVLVNKGGAGTLIGTQFVSRAEPDGHTIMLGSSTITVQPAINPRFTVDVLSDLTPIVEAVRGDFVLAGRSNLPARTMAEFVAHAKANPGKLTYGTTGAGTSPHVLMEYFAATTGTDFLHVPFQGSGDALNAVLAGNVDIMDNTVFTLKPHIDSGKLIAWAVTSAKRSPMLPDVPTVAESGYPGFNITYWTGFFGPPKMPPEVLAKLNAAFVKTLRNPEVVKRLAAMGLAPVGNTPAEFNDNLRRELVTWKKLVVERKLKVD